MSRVIQFRTSLKQYLRYFIIVGTAIIFLGIIFSTSWFTTVIVLLASVLYYGYWSALTRQVNGIDIFPKENRIIFLVHKNVFRKEAVEYSLNQLTGAYEKRTGARGIKIKVFRIYKDQEAIAELEPSFGGFTDRQIFHISEYLSQSKK